MTEPLKIDGEGLTLEQVEEVARGGRRAVLEETAAQRVEACRCQVEELLAEGRVVYGVTTGIGKFCDQVISPDSATRLQRNIIRSHAAGVGEPLRTFGVSPTRRLIYCAKYGISRINILWGEGKTHPEVEYLLSARKNVNPNIQAYKYKEEEGFSDGTVYGQD